MPEMKNNSMEKMNINSVFKKNVFGATFKLG